MAVVHRKKRRLRHLEARPVLRYLRRNEFKQQASGSETLDIDTSKGSPAMDYAQHLETYRDFLRFTKFAIVFLVILLIAMRLFLV
jgi:hypothetical protein